MLTFPLAPAPMPNTAQFLSISQPIAPQPTFTGRGGREEGGGRERGRRRKRGRTKGGREAGGKERKREREGERE